MERITRRYYVRPSNARTGWEVVSVVECAGVEITGPVFARVPTKKYGRVLAVRKNDALRRAGTYRAPLDAASHLHSCGEEGA